MDHEHGTVCQPVLEHQIRPSAPSSVISRPTCFSSSLRCCLHVGSATFVRRRCDCLASSAPFTNIQTYLLTYGALWLCILSVCVLLCFQQHMSVHCLSSLASHCALLARHDTCVDKFQQGVQFTLLWVPRNWAQVRQHWRELLELLMSISDCSWMSGAFQELADRLHPWQLYFGRKGSYLALASSPTASFMHSALYWALKDNILMSCTVRTIQGLKYWSVG